MIKKSISILLSLSITLSLLTPAFAFTPPPGYTEGNEAGGEISTNVDINIAGSGNGGSGENPGGPGTGEGPGGPGTGGEDPGGPGSGGQPEQDLYYYVINYHYDDSIETERRQGKVGDAIPYSLETPKSYAGHNWILDTFEVTKFITEDESKNICNIYYTIDDKDKDGNNNPDGIGDKYQTPDNPYIPSDLFKWRVDYNYKEPEQTQNVNNTGKGTVGSAIPYSAPSITSYDMKSFKLESLEVDSNVVTPVEENNKVTVNYAIRDVDDPTTPEEVKDQFMVTMDPDNNTKITTYFVDAGSKLTKPSDPEKPGYVFKYWVDVSTNIEYNFDAEVNSNLALKAIYEAEDGLVEYTVYHYKQTENNNTELTFEGEYDARYTLADQEKFTAPLGTEVTATPKNYTGYVYDADNTNTVSTGIVLDPSENDGLGLVLTLLYNRNQVTVRVDNDNGDEIQEYQVTYGSKFDRPETPEKPGYEFDGWAVNGKAYNFSTPVTADITIKAMWRLEARDVTYKLTHYKEDLDGKYTESEVEIIDCKEDQLVIAQSKSYIGFTENTKHPDRIASGMPKYDVQLELRLYYSRNEYIVTVNPDNGDPVQEIKVKYGDTFNEPEKLEKPDSTYTDWIDSDGNVVEFPIEITDNITIKPDWAPDGKNPTKPSELTIKKDGVRINNREIEVKQDEEFELDLIADNENTTIRNLGTDLNNDTIVVFGPDGKGFLINSAIESIGETKSDSNFNYLDTGDAIYNYPVSFLNARFHAGSKLPKQSYTVIVAWSSYKETIQEDLSSKEAFLNQPWTDVGIFTISVTGESDIPEPGDKEALYKVEHYWQNVTGSGYTLHETENLKGKVDSNVNAVAKAYMGFTEDTTNANRVSAGRITDTNSLVLRLYYNRNTYTVTIDKDNGSAVETLTVRYGGTLSKPADPVKDKYVFSTWVNKDTGLNFNFSLPITGNTNIIAKYTPSEAVQKYNYTVTYHYGVNTVDVTGSNYEGTTIPFSTGSKIYNNNNYCYVSYTAKSTVITKNESNNRIDVYYELDNLGNNGTIGDNIPDKYQVVVYFRAVYGRLSHYMTVVNKYDSNGNYSETGTARLQSRNIPTATANYGYRNGVWDKVPQINRVVTSGETFTIIYSRIPYYDTDDRPSRPPSGGSGSGGNGGNVNIDDNKIPLDETVLFDKENHIAYVSGFPDGTVGPNKNITRAQVVQIIYRLMDPEYRAYYYTNKNSFNDVAGNEWFNEALSTVAKADIVHGYTNGDFGPNNPITRAEFATMVSNFFITDNTEGNSLTDIKGHWAEKNINKVVTVGWMSGYSDGTFKPNNYITRAEAIHVINNILGRNVTKEAFLPTMKTWPDNMDTDSWYYADIQEATNGHEYERDTNNIEKWTKLNNK